MSPDPAPATQVPSTRASLVALVVFGAAMGWLEGVIVVYIRGVIGLGRDQGMPEFSEVMRGIHTLPWLLRTEQSREIATIVMLASVAWLAAERARARLGAFLVIFGVWDIIYYAALFTLLRWPPSLTTMDLLFLIPASHLWYQPVWMPLLASVVMILVGGRLFRKRSQGVQNKGGA